MTFDSGPLRGRRSRRIFSWLALCADEPELARLGLSLGERGGKFGQLRQRERETFFRWSQRAVLGRVVDARINDRDAFIAVSV